MNFYKHHIGDYATATAHLSFIEDGAYSRLIRRYYATEKPLPSDVAAVSRLVGARSKDERAAVAAMLEEFFVLEEDGWHQKRCDLEIASAQGKADRNREVGKLGGRPHKSETQTVSKSKPSGNPNGYFHEPTDNPLQTPVTSNQEPEPRLQNFPSKITPTLPVSSPVMAESDAEKGSVCGNFKKIGGEKPSLNGTRPPDAATPSTDEILAQLRKEHGRANR